MQQRSLLRIVLVVIGFCDIAAGQLTPFCESTGAHSSAISTDIRTAQYFTTVTFEFHMPGYDKRFEEWKPVAIQWRQIGFTPQAICTQLAYDIFNDRTKYNTVKGWYQRTFNEWPSESYNTKSKEQRRPQHGISNQQRTRHLPNTFSANCLPQRSFSQHEQSRRSPQASSANTYNQTSYALFQAMGEVLPPDDNTVMYQSDREAYRHAPSHHHPPNTFAGSYNMDQLCEPQNMPGGLDLPASPGEYISLPQHLGKSGGDVPRPPVGSITPPHQQDQPQIEQQGCSKDAMSRATEGRNPVRYDVERGPNEQPGHDMDQTNLANEEVLMSFEQFLNSDSAGAESLESMSTPLRGRNLSLDDQRFTLQGNAPPKQPFLAHIDQSYPPSQMPHQTSTPQGVDMSFANSLHDGQLHDLPSHQYSSSTLTAQHGTTRASNKHYRSNSILAGPTPPPQRPLPPDPPGKLSVIHRECNVKAWRPTHVKEGSMVTIDPNRLPTDHPPKRVKGLGTESRDSMAIYPDHVKAPHLVAPEVLASWAEHAAATRIPLALRPVNSSNVSVRSSLRDSGYISMLDSTVVESFSTLNLTDAECKTDYKEADDGYVEAEITIKGRWRRSHLERMHSPVAGLES